MSMVDFYESITLPGQYDALASTREREIERKEVGFFFLLVYEK